MHIAGERHQNASKSSTCSQVQAHLCVFCKSRQILGRQKTQGCAIVSIACRLIASGICWSSPPSSASPTPRQSSNCCLAQTPLSAMRSVPSTIVDAPSELDILTAKAIEAIDAVPSAGLDTRQWSAPVEAEPRDPAGLLAAPGPSTGYQPHAQRHLLGWSHRHSAPPMSLDDSVHACAPPRAEATLFGGA